jgi:DNA-binding response OmpR family regulator
MFMAKILVIDDEQAIVELLTLRLTEAGHQVVVALDGFAGPMVATREKPDLIILDYNMPAANGAKVHERLRGNTFTAATPIIFLTATPIGEIIMGVKDDDRTRFLQKPVDFPLLAKTIAVFLGGAAPPPAPPAVPPTAPPNDLAGGDVLDLD